MQQENVSKLTFSATLRRLMKVRGIKDGPLGQAVGVSHVSVGHYRRGKSMPEPPVLRELAKFFDVSMEELLGAEVPYRSTDELMELTPSQMTKEEFERVLEEAPPFTPEEAENLLAAYHQITEMLQTMAPAMQKLEALRRKFLPREVDSNIRQQVKSKRGHLRDIDSVTMAIYNEMGAGAALMPTSKPIGEVKVRRGRFPADTFAVRVVGTSMIDAGVKDRSLVAMRWIEYQEPQPGDIVCVHILGDGSVLKQLVEMDGHQWLISRNPEYPDICLDCEGEPLAHIQAVLIGKI